MAEKARPVVGRDVTVNFTGNDGQTYSMVLDQVALTSSGQRLSIHGNVSIEAAPMVGIDRRLDNQRASIDRLLGHVQAHCPAARGEKCPYTG